MTLATAVVLVAAPLSVPGSAAPGGDTFHGSVGRYDFRDRLADHTGVTCHYQSNGKLHTIEVTPPRVQPLTVWVHKHLQTYAKWAVEVQHKSHGHWANVGGWHEANLLKLPSSASWRTFRALSPVKVKAKVNGTYRLLERAEWLNHDTGKVQGSVAHFAGAYYYGPHTSITTSCHDKRPTASSFSQTMLAGSTLNLSKPGLLKHAKDADHDKLTLKVLSAKEDGSTRSYVAHGDGSFALTTLANEAGKKILVKYVAIDPAGVRSAPATFTINVHGQIPGLPTNVSVSNVDITGHTGGDPNGVSADLTWTPPASGGAPACYDVRAVIEISGDGGLTFAPDPGAPQTFTCQTTTPALSNIALAPDMNGAVNYVLWQVRGRNSTGVGSWTTVMNTPVPNEVGQTGPDAFQVLRYSGYWINSQSNATPPDCLLNDTIKTQSPSSGTHPAGTEVIVQAYGEVPC